MVTVVDAASFLRAYNEADALQNRGESLGEEEIQLLKKLVFIVEDNFLASWTIVSAEKDQGNEVRHRME